MGLLIQTETLLRIEAPRVVGGMLSEVEFRRVLHDEHNRMLAHPPLRGPAMRLQN